MAPRSRPDGPKMMKHHSSAVAARVQIAAESHSDGCKLLSFGVWEFGLADWGINSNKMSQGRLAKSP